MLFFVVFSVLSFLNLGTEAVQKEEIPKFYREIERKEGISKCSDIAPLLNKLISELEGMKGQILHEMPEQLAKQELEMKKIANGLENVKGMIIDHANKTDSSIFQQTEEIKKIVNDLGDVKNCCTKQLDESKNYQQYLRRIETSADNVTIRTTQISESLRVHDQLLKNVTNRDFCKTSYPSPTPSPRDCSDIRIMGSKSNGVYRIYLNDNNIPKDVYCDFSTPGGEWLVFQRREDGSVDFYRNWNNYSDGFGNPNGEFWLGNEILNQITSNRKYKLRIDLEDFENQKRYAEYSSFSIGPSSDYYRLKIGTYSGNAGDSLSYHNNQQFSTPDVDRDQHSALNCAANYCQGSWWFHSCHFSNLNGRYWRGAYSGNPTGVVWFYWRGTYHYSLKATEMKIARLQ